MSLLLLYFSYPFSTKILWKAPRVRPPSTRPLVKPVDRNEIRYPVSRFRHEFTRSFSTMRFCCIAKTQIGTHARAGRERENGRAGKWGTLARRTKPISRISPRWNEHTTRKPGKPFSSEGRRITEIGRFYFLESTRKPFKNCFDRETRTLLLQLDSWFYDRASIGESKGTFAALRSLQWKLDYSSFDRITRILLPRFTLNILVISIYITRGVNLRK